MGERLLKFAEVSHRVGLGRSAIYSRMKKGDFPEVIKIGSASRWAESKIDAWLEQALKTHVMRQSIHAPLPPKRGKVGGREWVELVLKRKKP